MRLHLLAAGLVLAEGVVAAGRDGLVRGLLADLLGCDQAGIRTGRTARGKPLLLSPPASGYSLSRRDDLMLLGVARGVAIGVDLEQVRSDLPLLDIAASCFAEAESGFLRGLPAPLRARAFCAFWTAKEAVLKATGQGIVDGMQVPCLDGAALMPLVAGATPVTLRPDRVTRLELRALTVAGQAVTAARALVAS